MENFMIEQPHLKKFPRRIMTLVVGILCKEGIVMASEGQSTRGTKTIPSGPKIFEVEFRDGQQALLGVSGDSRAASYIAQKAIEKAKSIALSRDDFVNMVRPLVYQVRQEILRGAGVDGQSQDDGFRQRIMQENSFSTLLAFYAHPKAHLIEIDSRIALDVERRPYGVLGNGGDIAEFLLPTFKVETMTLAEAAVTAIYVIEMAKRFDSTCGFETQVGSVDYAFTKMDLPVQVTFASVRLHSLEKIRRVAEHITRRENERPIDWRVELEKTVRGLADIFTENEGAFSTPSTTTPR